MRVLRISHSAAVDEWRGRERGLRDLGVDVHLLSGMSTDAGGAVVTLRPRPGEQVTGVRMLGSHPALFLFDPRPIWRALGETWDVVDIHEEPFALATAEILLLKALRRCRAPYVLYTAQNLRKRYPLPFRWFEKRALRHAAGLSACNSDAAAIAVEKGLSGAARVIPLGVDLDRFAPAEPPTEATTPRADADADPDAPIVVGFVGRLVAEKGAGSLLDAAASDPRLRIRIAGTGPEEPELRRRSARLGVADRVEFAGTVDPGVIQSFYTAIDVLAVPSLPTPRWTEQFGRVAVEAMACGVPVVSSDAGALPDVVGGAGIVVPRGDVRALTAALVEASGPRSAELRALGHARAVECSWGAVAADYLDLYRLVVRPTPGAQRGVEVIVVAYGQPDLLREALEPLAGLPLTVVDNSSLPEIAAICNDAGGRYLDPGRNLGFGGGVNRALADRLSPADDVLLVNPDARIELDDIAVLREALRARPDLASVAPAQTDGQGVAGRVLWPFPSPVGSWIEALGLGRLRRGPQFAIGSVLLLRAEALAQVGTFDERFFLYAEETDWAYRAHLVGWRHAEVATARATHIGAATSSDPRRREIHFHASQERYLRKHFGAGGWNLARAAVWLGSMARSVVLPRDRARQARLRAALYRIGPIAVERRLPR